MGIKIDDVVSVSHYSVTKPFISYIHYIDNETVILKLTRDFAANNLLEGDPVVIGYESENDIHLLGCDILSIDIKNSTMKLQIDKTESDANKRTHKRFPVSLYADIVNLDTRKKSVAIIKDISIYGMLIFSKTDYIENQRLELDLYLDKNVIFLKSYIARKANKTNYFEYGLVITYENARAINFMEDYLKKLGISYEQNIKKIKSGI